MSARPTPGPWLLDPPDDDHVVREDYHIIYAGDKYSSRISGCMSLADARLIHAAPDLLAALEAALFALEMGNQVEIERIANVIDLASCASTGRNVPLGDMIRNAIAKARDGEPASSPEDDAEQARRLA